MALSGEVDGKILIDLIFKRHKGMAFNYFCPTCKKPLSILKHLVWKAHCLCCSPKVYGLGDTVESAVKSFHENIRLEEERKNGLL